MSHEKTFDLHPRDDTVSNGSKREHLRSHDLMSKYRFTDDWVGFRVEPWRRVLAPLAHRPNLRYLEIGAWEGRSLIWMLENILTHPSCHATVVDPYMPRDEYQRLNMTTVPAKRSIFLSNLLASGRAEAITLVSGYSQIALRGLPIYSFDIIYIDGAHDADDVMEDAMLCHRLIKNGGILIFDDYAWPDALSIREQPKPAVDFLLEYFGDRYDLLEKGYQVIVQKKPHRKDYRSDI